MLEPDAGQLASPVLRGAQASNGLRLLDRGKSVMRGVAVVRRRLPARRCLNPRQVSRFQSPLVEPNEQISRIRLSRMSLRPSLAPRLRDWWEVDRGRGSHRDTRSGIGGTRCLSSLAVESAIAGDVYRCTSG